MGRFDMTPPAAQLPRNEHPDAAGDNPGAPDVPADMPDLPMIPMEKFAGNIPEAAEDHLPDFFGGYL